jgi:hypothetical protein
VASSCDAPSIPRWPAMWGRATLAMEESSTSIKVASVTVSAMAHWLGARHHGEVLGSDPLAVVDLGDGVGEAVGLARMIEIVNEFLGEQELVRRALDEEGVLSLNEKDFVVRVEHVPDCRHDLTGLVAIADVVEVEDLGRVRAGWCVFCLSEGAGAGESDGQHGGHR